MVTGAGGNRALKGNILPDLFFGFILLGFNYFQFEKEKNAYLKERA
jgi:hypothetical protein